VEKSRPRPTVIHNAIEEYLIESDAKQQYKDGALEIHQQADANCPLQRTGLQTVIVE